MSGSFPLNATFRAAAFERAEPPAFLDSMPAHAKSEPLNAIDLSIHTEFGDLEEDWRDFERIADCTVFQSFAWLSAFHRHIGKREGVALAIVAGRRRDGSLLFLLSLAVGARRFVRRLGFLGSELCDYNAPLIAPEFSREVGPDRFIALWGEIRQLVDRHPELGHDMIVLCKMPETIGGQPNPFLHLRVALHPSGAHLAHLTGDWDQFYRARRSSATRRRDRIKRTRMADHGEIRFVAPESREEIERSLATLIDQKMQSFAHRGVANMFARTGYEEFYRDIATDPATRHLIHVSRLDVGSAVAAVNLGAVFHGRYYHLLASYNAGPLSRFGPGVAHLHELMRYAIAAGCREFDFTIGDEGYKRDWCDADLKLYDHAAPVMPRGLLVIIPAVAFSRLKRFVKQTPILWRAFNRLRSSVASLHRAEEPGAGDGEAS
jgi:CelD/BcsL family acetyltransferase involved in cellulose biosynthesis